MLPQINMFPQFGAIFIFDFDKNQSKEFVFEHTKFIDIYNDLDNLYLSIEEQIELDNELFETFSFFDQSKYSIENLSKQTSDLFWYQFVGNILLQLSHNQLDKNEMIDLCRQYYQDNLKYLKIIDEFEHEYHSNKVIQWFLKRSFPYKMIKKALQIKDINQLIRLRYFISDLLQSFSNQFHNTIEYEYENFIVHRGMKLSKEQIEEFRKKSRKTSFELNENIFYIKLRISNEGPNILEKYIEDTRQQIEDLDNELIFGHLMLDMGQWDQSQKYFERLLIDSNNKKQAWIQYSLGQIHRLKGEWIIARQYYDCAYAQMMNPNQICIKESAQILSDIGELLYIEGKFEEAINFHEQALQIRRKYYSSDHPHIANSLRNIGDIFHKKDRYDEAFVYFQEAFTILEKYYKSFHPDIAKCMSSIGYYFREQRNNDKSLESHQRSLTIYEKCYPTDHVSIALTLNDIADSLLWTR
ncbi:unnamed protein product [Rotaria sp. Silwood2]|nr:unnamed protein product [Rotaria sp. Silwood2]CAF4342426.1 unnamed protein product [Rotaria sp. Silwood2]